MSQTEFSEHILIAEIADLKQQVADLKRENADMETMLRVNTEHSDNMEKELIETLDNLKKTQSQLIQTEKMAALGQLIAGVAHEINTPLGAIRASVGNMSDSLREMPEQLPELFGLLSREHLKDFFGLLGRSLRNKNELSSKEEREHKKTLIRMLEEHGSDNADHIADMLTDMGICDNIEPFLPLLLHSEIASVLKTAYNLSALRKSSRNIAIAADRAYKVVFALKSYARFDNTGKKSEALLTDGIETVLTLYHNKLRNIEVTRQFENLPPISCYPDELCQVWTNLLHNAIQAMDNKGTLDIGICRKDNQAVVTFADSGQGIPDEIRERIFEPFFTTKPMGEGSGLGLFIVGKIIERHGGNIETESRPGRTVFRVILPNNVSV